MSRGPNVSRYTTMLKDLDETRKIRDAMSELLIALYERQGESVGRLQMLAGKRPIKRALALFPELKARWEKIG